MRLFAAVLPPEPALTELGAYVDALHRLPGADTLRWTERTGWHLTLAFYGEVADRDLARLRRRIDRALRSTPTLTLALAGSGAFRRRAVWLGVTGDVDLLRRTADAVSDDDRSYRPHLTVARLRGDTDPTAAVADLAAYAGPSWTADEVHLVRSHLGPEPAYEDVATWPLGAGGGP